MKQEVLMKMMAEANSSDEICPVIDKIAELANGSFELLSELSYITNVDAGHGLIKVGSSLVPFANEFPKNTKLYQLMTTKPGEGLDVAAPALSNEEEVLNMIRRVFNSNPEFGEKMKKYLAG